MNTRSALLFGPLPMQGAELIHRRALAKGGFAGWEQMVEAELHVIESYRWFHDRRIPGERDVPELSLGLFARRRYHG